MDMSEGPADSEKCAVKRKDVKTTLVSDGIEVTWTPVSGAKSYLVSLFHEGEDEPELLEKIEEELVHVFKSFRGTKYFCSVLAQNEDQTPIGQSRISNTVIVTKEPHHNVNTPDSSNNDHEREDEVHADNNAQEKNRKVEGQNSKTGNKGREDEAGGGDRGEPADDLKMKENLEAESVKPAGDSSVNSPEADALTGYAVLSSDDESDSDTDDRKNESSVDKDYNYDFRIKIKKKKVVCTWNKRDDVKIYFATIRTKIKQHNAIRCETNEVTFSKSEFELHFGDSFEIQVESENGSVKSDFVPLKIGGRTEPRGVAAVRCADKPSDIIVKWNPPEAKPHGYEVTILQNNKKRTKLPVTNTQVTFNDIKNPRASCRFKVKPVYKHRRKVISTFSEEVEPMEESFIPSMVRLKHGRSDPCRILYLSWQKPQIDADSYKVTLWRNDTQRSQVESVEVTANTTSFDHLNPSTEYYGEVVAVYDGKKVTPRGVLSNVMKTKDRQHGDDEKKEDFGRVKGIRCELIRERGNWYGLIHWDPAALNENFKHTDYDAQLRQEGNMLKKLLRRTLVKITELPDTEGKNGYRTDTLPSGKTYTLSITHKFEDVDTGHMKNTTAEYIFHTPPRLNQFVQNPETNSMTLSWEAVSKVKSYKFHIKDRALENTLLEENVDDTKYTIDLANVPIRVGYTCMIKLYPLIDNDAVSITLDWSSVTIGGEIVPQDVIAEPHASNPCRSVRVKFDKPNSCNGLTSYDIEARPHIGQTKTLNVKTEGEVVLTHLKQNTSYTFFVRAVFKSDKSEWSISNSLKTDSGEIYEELPENENFGKIQNYRKKKVGTLLPDKYRYLISWKAPDFDDRNDIEIEKISCLVQTADGGSGNLATNTTSPQCDLTLGKVYQVTITTHFLLIDKDEKRTAVFTKIEEIPIDNPTDLKLSWSDRQLTFSWKKCFGVLEYEWDVVDGSEDMKILKPSSKSQSIEKTFDMHLPYSYGRQCVFRVTALHNKNSSERAEIKTIVGEPHVPTSVTLKPATNDPGREMCATWNQAKEIPTQGYKVEMRQAGGDWDAPVYTQSTSHVFSQLKPEKKYQCRVSAVYDGLPMLPAMSDVQSTARRSKTVEEESPSFGLPIKDLKIDCKHTDKSASAEVFCGPACLGNNYKFLRYTITLLNENATDEYECMEGKNIAIERLQLARKYILSLTTEFMDKDTKTREQGSAALHAGEKKCVVRWVDGKRFITRTKEQIFYTKGLPARNIRCEGSIAKKTIEFSWDYPEDCDQNNANVETYNVEIKDEHDVLFSKGNILENKLTLSFDENPQLRMGMSCFINITTLTMENEKVPSGFHPISIGPDDIPRNVKATRDHRNPRWMKINFDPPRCCRHEAKNEPESYTVRAVPVQGHVRRIEEFPRSQEITMKDLRLVTKYYFVVRANYKGTPTLEAAVSNHVITGEDESKPDASVFNMPHSQKHKITFQHSKIEGKGMQKPPRLKGFGQVLNLEFSRKDDGDNEIYDFLWNSPMFEKKNDFRIDHYQMRVLKENGDVVYPRGGRDNVDAQCFVKNVSLPIGGFLYTVEVVTFFEEIDLDEGTEPSETVSKSLATKPRQATRLEPTWDEAKLSLHWNSAEGAVTYGINLYKDDAKDPFYSEFSQKPCHEYQIKKQEIGFGNKCTIEIVSIGKKDSRNSVLLDTIAGGDHVPRNVTAESLKNGRGDYKRALVKWEKPKKEPIRYQVFAITSGQKSGAHNVKNETECELNELLAGVKYTFGVLAVSLGNDGEEHHSVMNLSEPIDTEPKPNKLQEVTIRPHHPSPRLLVNWDKLDEKVANKFEIVYSSHYGETSLYTTHRSEYVIRGLRPNTDYKVKIRASNASGFGEFSDSKSATTHPGEVSNVRLEPCDKWPTKSLKLKFSGAIGADDYVIRFYERKSQDQCLSSANWSDIRKHEKGYPVSKVIFEVDNEEMSDSATSDDIQVKTIALVVKNLQRNIEYMASVIAKYHCKQGRSVPSNPAWTATEMQQRPKVTLCKDGDGMSSQNVHISWEQSDECRDYQVSVEAGDEPEAEITITRSMLRYTCKKESREYKFRVCSRNQSGYFGDMSPDAVIQLAPSTPTAIVAKRDGDVMLVKWKSGERACDHEVEIFKDGKKVDSTIVKNKEDFQYHKGQNAAIYHFRVRGVLSSEKHKEESNQLETVHIRGRSRRSNDVPSRPEKPELTSAHVNRCQHDPSTCIEACMTDSSKQMRDFLEIAVRQPNPNECESERTIFLREGGSKVCLNGLRPGCRYAIAMRSWWQSAGSCWSDEQSLLLAPGRVSLRRFEGKDRKISIEWQQMFEEGITYHVTLYEKKYGNADFCEKLNDDVGELTTFTTDGLDFAGEYFFEVYAKNEAGHGSKLKTDIYTCPWKRPESIKVEFTDELRFRGAVLSWERPDGVENFKLEMDDRAPITLDDCTYKFGRGVPGHYYEFRLYCGCDGKFGIKCTKATLQIPPAKPKSVKAEADKTESDKILVVIDEPVPQPLKYRVAIYLLHQEEGDLTKKEIKVNFTISNKHTFFGIKPEKKYIVGVKSHDADDYESRECYSNEVQPVAILPQNIRVQSKEDDPTTRIVEFDDQKNPRKCYKVTARNMDDETTILQSTTGHRVELGGFKRGKRYAVEIETFIDKMSLGKSYYRGPNERGPRKEN